MENAEKIAYKNKAQKAFIILALLIAIALFTTVISSYITKFEKALVAENSNYLAEISSQTAINMQMMIGETKKALEGAAFGLCDVDNEKRIKYLNKLLKEYNFEYVSFSWPDGTTQYTLESENANLQNEDYFKEALNGNANVKYCPHKFFTDKVVSALIFSVPVYNVDYTSPKGVMCAMIDVNTLKMAMNTTSFSGEGHTYVIDAKGNVIVQTKQLNFSNLYTALGNCKFGNSYNLNKVIEDISTQKPGFAVYYDFGVEKYMYYSYLGIDEWSIVTVVDKATITAATTQLAQELTVVAVLIMILFPILLVMLALSMQMSKSQKHAAQMKSAFLANMSHEIRTPMNAIVGISEILLREELSNKQKNYVMNIVNSGKGLLTIINDVLDVSKMESGKFKIVDDEYELESLIYDIVTIMAIKIGDKPIELLVDLDTELPKYIVGDMIRVKQILLNIMGNAVKFTNEGFIRLNISAEMENGKLKLGFCVSDTGIGIQKKDLKDLFASFSQVDTHKNHNIEGTGLGLSISKNLCEMMGGDIQVASEYGKGTAFTMHIMQKITRPEKMIYNSKASQFHILMLEKSLILREYFAMCMDKMNLEYLMCDNDDDFMANIKKGGFTHAFARAETIGIISSQTDEMPIASYVALLGLREQGLVENYKASVYIPLFALQMAPVLYNREKNLHLGRHMGIDVLAIQPLPFVKILLVDDNEVNVQVANGLLSPYYMQVDCAFSGAKAIALIKENDYDLVFMDHMMPEMDGAEAVKIIRALPNNKKNVHIVALTANITEGAKEMFVEVGFDDFLAKPIETVKLNMLIKKWLKETNDKRAEDNPAKAEEYHKTIMMHQMENAQLSNAVASSCAFVDFANAAKKLGGKKAYCDILSTYSQSLKEKMLKLQGWLSSDIQRFTIEVHGLKGASAGVSANALAQFAAQIETLASDNNVEKVQGLLPELFANMQKTLDEVEKYILDNSGENTKENVTSIGKTVVHGALSNEVLTDIKEAFYNYDSEKIKRVIAEQDKLLHDAREAELLDNLGKCLNCYDFEAPLALIDEYAKQIIQKGSDDSVGNL